MSNLKMQNEKEKFKENVEWNLGSDKYRLIHYFDFDKSFTYADMREGKQDYNKREYIRSEAAKSFPQEIPKAKWWAFRIFVAKSGKRSFDIDNVLKLIVDAFCKRQISQDKSRYANLGLYEDDTLDFVKILEVAGKRGNSDFTKVEIFGHL